MRDPFKPTFIRMGNPINKSRPPTSIRPPTQGGQASRTDLVVTTALAGTTTTWAVDLPTYTAGDRVFVCVSAADTLAADITGVDGFTELKTSADAEKGAVYQRIMTGTEGSTVDVTFASSAQTAVAIAFAHRGIDWTTYTTDIATAFSAASGTPDPPQVSLSHGSQATYDVYVFWGGVHGSGTVEVTSPSTGYTELVDQSTGPGDTSAGLMHRQVTGAVTEDPDGFTINTGSAVAVTFAIPAVGAAEIQEGVVVYDDGTEIGTYRRLDFRSGTNVTVVVAEDGSDSTQADITINSSGGGAGGVPDWISDLAAPDSAHGDDQEFTGSIGGTAVTPTGTATWTQDEGLLSVAFEDQTSGDHAARLFALTPTAAPVTITTRLKMMSKRSSNPMAGLVFADGTTAASNAVAVGIYYTTNSPIIARWAGTLTNMSTTNIDTAVGVGYPDSWMFMRLIWTASNTWAWALSPDGISWTDFEASTFAATLTPTYFGVFVSSWSTTFVSAAAFEYIRVAESDLSV